MILSSILFGILLPVLAQQRVLELDISIAKTSRHYERLALVKILLSGDHWSITCKYGEGRIVQWGYDGSDVVGLTSAKVKHQDGTDAGMGHWGHLDPGQVMISADDNILAAWLAYCSQAYFQLSDDQRPWLDIPWKIGNEAYEASFNSDDFELDKDNTLPTLVFWKWDSERRSQINSHRPFDDLLKVRPNNNIKDGWIIGKYELLEWSQVDEWTRVPKHFKITRYRVPQKDASSAGDAVLTTTEGKLRKAQWRELDEGELFVPALPQSVEIEDYRHSDQLHFKLKHRYRLRNATAWPMVNDPTVQANLLTSKIVYNRMYLQPSTIWIPFFGRAQPSKAFMFVVLTGGGIGLTIWLFRKAK